MGSTEHLPFSDGETTLTGSWTALGSLALETAQTMTQSAEDYFDDEFLLAGLARGIALALAAPEWAAAALAEPHGGEFPAGTLERARAWIASHPLQSTAVTS